MNEEPRMVQYPVFQSWWDGIIELSQQSPNDKDLDALLGALQVIGRQAGAIHAQGSSFDINRDWQGEAIDFAIDPQLMLEWSRRYEPAILIARLIKVTGISE